MSASVKQVLDAALALSEVEQSELTAHLLEKLEPETWTPEDWDHEIQQPVNDIRSGKAHMIPWDQARRELWDAVDGRTGD
jgi:hypothetical protein